mmetsp:Transcript_11348/g.23496  ORF Transcript_11348/g.23496 Transcript_11348/m.23496 type:complete len:344 (+) Transcript_11348:165-1196(+)|eukprot:CAMPEP_0197275212 /NCGR_PEP_ID=MMETSP1432-20130617/13642_1 /TAXON_ID=44447 /ORGANISM="Pseudo-nitzschia delicatissima, Strain UNC1205" /LENGTH=343 /DNA_ID=CAMNT_0042741091 /DNA_START=143 /DNA_END=1174 /DNA_ORIENTATION=+
METLTTLLALLTLPLLDAFHVPSPMKHSFSSRSDRIRIFAGKDEEMNFGPGMEDAFKELESLSSLGGDSPSEKPQEKEEAFASAMEGLDLKDILSKAEAEVGSSPESDFELYKDMASELDVASSEEDLIAADFKNDLELAESKEAGIPAIDTEKFMDKAINEAINDAKEQDNSVNVDDAKEAFLDNKEIMSEIEKIFDKANDDLMEELEEIRAEQAALAKEQAERNSAANLEKIEDTEKRMEVAQGNMKKMLKKVNAETKAVEDAIEDLKMAQAATEGGIDSQLVDLKSGGLIKQAALAGGLLFTLRSGAETIAFLAGDPSHAFPALIQGALAIACIIGFIFL